MKILFVIGSLREGGAEGQLLLLMKGMQARGHVVALMLLRYEGARLDGALKDGFEIMDAGVPLFRPRWNPAAWIGAVGALIRSRQIVQDYRPDIIHANLFWAHLWACLLVTFSSRRVSLVTSRLQLSRKQTQGPFQQFIENRINRRADCVIANAKVVAKGCLRAEKNLRGKITVVYNGIALDEIRCLPAANPKAFFFEEEAPSIIAINVASLIPGKGHRDLIRAWGGVVARHSNAKLLCVGADGGLLRSLTALSKKSGLESAVAFAGSRDDVLNLVKGADFAVQASRDEGMSVALLEYMACGLPIVATDVGGTREAVRDGESALLVRPGDSADLAEKILALTGNEELRRKLAAGAAAAVEKFSAKEFVSNHLRIYEGLLAGRR